MFGEALQVALQVWSDILGILTTQGEALDFTYIRGWADELQILDLLERAVAETSPR